MEHITDIQQFKVTGMHCNSCVAKVKTALSVYDPDVNVSLDPPLVTLHNSHVHLDVLQNALKQAGKYVLQATPSTKPTQPVQESDSVLSTYKPLIIILTYILLCTGVIQLTQHQINLKEWMAHFMAGFFISFSFFKLLDLKSFANSYAMYDILAMRWHTYAYIYPFIELALGLAYILAPHAKITNLIALSLMLFSSIGVIRAVINRQKIRCACLGTVFNLPMTTVTIIEDLAMAAMAGLMLI